jgi:hypothetical protein
VIARLNVTNCKRMQMGATVTFNVVDRPMPSIVPVNTLLMFLITLPIKSDLQLSTSRFHGAD